MGAVITTMYMEAHGNEVGRVVMLGPAGIDQMEHVIIFYRLRIGSTNTRTYTYIYTHHRLVRPRQYRIRSMGYVRSKRC
jgi:hypothetical protein